MSETKNDECQDQPFSNRASLITYLEYVVDEVAAVDEPAAVLLRMAISNLAIPIRSCPVPITNIGCAEKASSRLGFTPHGGWTAWRANSLTP